MLPPSSENTIKSYGENHVRRGQEDVLRIRELAHRSETRSKEVNKAEKRKCAKDYNM